MAGLDGFYAARSSELEGFEDLPTGWPLVAALRYTLRGESVEGVRAHEIGRGELSSMAGLSIAERARLSLLLGRRALRITAAAGCAAHPLIRWNLLPPARPTGC